MTCSTHPAGEGALDHGLGRRSERDEFKAWVRELGAEWRLLYFDVPLDELARRLERRRDEGGAVPDIPPFLEFMRSTSEDPEADGEELVAR